MEGTGTRPSLRPHIPQQNKKGRFKTKEQGFLVASCNLCNFLLLNYALFSTIHFFRKALE